MAKAKRIRRDWDEIIGNLNNGSGSTKKRIKMGSPGSAQVTRDRLLKAYKGLYSVTKGDILILSLSPI